MNEIYNYFDFAGGREDIAFLSNGDSTVTISVAFLDTLMEANNYARGLGDI